jgi:EAL domain-containing protein (putative c-di-GMP-specific phosphodiesterase class I)
LFGYEAFLRFDDSCLPDPGAVVDAAERLGRVEELGRMVRVRAAAAMENAPPGALLFINVHPAELGDRELTSPQSPLGRIAPRVVLEVTERARLDGAGDVSQNAAALREQGFRIAVDDLGAGYAGLSKFALLEPDMMKLDTELVRGVDRDEKRKRVVRTMAELGRDLKMEVVAEGVETSGERDVLRQLGCSLMQGYFFARPSRTFPALQV